MNGIHILYNLDDVMHVQVDHRFIEIKQMFFKQNEIAARWWSEHHPVIF